MIAKQYKNETRMGKERGKNGKRKGQEWHWNGVKNGLEWGQKWVLNGIKNGISPNSRIWNGEERLFFAVPHLSSRFLAVPPLFSCVFHDFGQKREKKRVPKNGGTGKERTRSFPVSFRSHFLPFLSWHISTAGWWRTPQHSTSDDMRCRTSTIELMAHSSYQTALYCGLLWATFSTI